MEWFPDRKLILLGDGAYSTKNLLGGLDPRVTYIGVMRADAAIYDPVPPKQSKSRRGPKSHKGPRLPNPKEAVKKADCNRGGRGPWTWQTVKATAYGATRKLRVVSFQAVWPEVMGLTPILVVLVRDPRGKFDDKYLFTTDVNADLGWIIESVLAEMVDRGRLQIEQAGDEDTIPATLVSPEHRKVVAVGVVDAKRDRSVVHYRRAQTAGGAGRASSIRRVGHGMVACSYASHSPHRNPRSHNYPRVGHQGRLVSITCRPGKLPKSRRLTGLKICESSASTAAPIYRNVLVSQHDESIRSLLRRILPGCMRMGWRAAAIEPRVRVSLVEGKPHVDCTLLIAELEMLKTFGLTGDTPWIPLGFGSIGGKGPTDPGYDELYVQAVADVERQLKERQLPKFLWYPVDEPADSPERLAAAKRWLGLIKTVPGARTFCNPISPKAISELTKLIDGFCHCQQGINPENVALINRNHGTLYFYTSAYGGDRLPARIRFLNGLFLYKSEAKAVFYWHYQCPVGDPLNDLDGTSGRL